MTALVYPENTTSLADFLEHKLKQYETSPAYTALGQTLTFKQVDHYSYALACFFLHKLGLVPGDRIAVQLPNILQNPIVVYAALRAGLVVVNTNPLYTEREMCHQFNDSGATCLVILRDFMPKYMAIADKTQIKHVIVTAASDWLAPSPSPTLDNAIGLLDAIALAQGLTLPARPQGSLDDVCMLQYTGGTTGVSKGAMLTHRNILANSLQSLDRLSQGCTLRDEVVVCPLPLYHIYAFTVCMMTFFGKGSHIILIPNPRDIDGFIDALRPHKITTFVGINTLFVGLASHPNFTQLDFSKLHLTLSGGTALTSGAATQWQKLTACTITEGYGLSETSPVLCFNIPQHEEFGTVGPAVQDTDILLLDEQDHPVADGEAGEIAGRGPQVMPGYWQRPDETAKVMTTDGFFKTGDIGVRLPSGAIKIVDRLKDMILVSGFNVYPNEVEDILTAHPAVQEAAVVGTSDDNTGEKVVAYITVLSPIATEQLIAYCKKFLTPYKVPKDIRVLTELPKSTVGKILRRELRKSA
jgi:long-chain acyl-CoA synthetase